MSLVLQEVVWSHFPCTLTMPTDIFCRFQMFILLTASHPVLQELFKEHVGFLFVKKTLSGKHEIPSWAGHPFRFMPAKRSLSSPLAVRVPLLCRSQRRYLGAGVGGWDGKRRRCFSSSC